MAAQQQQQHQQQHQNRPLQTATNPSEDDLASAFMAGHPLAFAQALTFVLAKTRHKKIARLIDTIFEKNPPVAALFCLDVLPLLHGHRLGHSAATLILECVGRLDVAATASHAAAQLFWNVATGRCTVDPPILLRITRIYRLSSHHVHSSVLIPYVMHLLYYDPNESDIHQGDGGHAITMDADKGATRTTSAETRAQQTQSAPKKGVTTAVRLLLHFKPREIMPDAVLGRLLKQEMWLPALEFSKTFGDKASNRRVIEAFYASGQHKLAMDAVNTLHMQHEFPEARREYKKHKLKKFVKKGAIELAASQCGNDRVLQMFLVELLLDQGLVTVALEYRDRFGLHEAFPIDKETLQRQEQLYRDTYLELPAHLQHQDAIVFVDSDRTLELFRKCLLDASDGSRNFGNGDGDGATHQQQQQVEEEPLIVGLDSEWRPSFKNEVFPVSVLQVATMERVFILDLLCLQERQFGPVVSELFQRPDIVKTGFAFAGDMQQLRRSYPEAECFQRIVNLVELDTLATATAPGWGRSLSDLTKHVLGKQLCKVDRMTNWENRPLTRRQMSYAALDAWCCVKLVYSLVSEPTMGKLTCHCDEINNRVDVVDVMEAEEAALVTSLDGLGLSMQMPPSSVALTSAHIGAVLKHLEMDPSTMLFRREAIEAFHEQSAVDVEKSAANTTSREHQPKTATFDAEDRRGSPAPAQPPATSMAKDDTHGRSQNAPECREQPAEWHLCSSVPAEWHGRTLSYLNAMAFFCQDEPVLVLIRAGIRVDLKKLAVTLSIPKRQVQMATPFQCISTFGYSPGTMPPLALRKDVRTIVDTTLSSLPMDTILVCGGGDAHVRLCLSLGLLSRTVKHTVADVAMVIGPCAGSAQVTSAASRGVQPRFIADNMLCRLARWLRCAGVDTSVHQSQDVTELLRVASTEQRIILTSSRKVIQRCKHVPAFYVTKKELQAQLKEVASHFDLMLDEAEFLSRCSKCNSNFEAISREEAAKYVPQRVLDRVKAFWRCVGCHQIVWQGSQYRRIKETFSSVYGSLGIDVNMDRFDVTSPQDSDHVSDGGDESEQESNAADN